MSLFPRMKQAAVAALLLAGMAVPAPALQGPPPGGPPPGRPGPGGPPPPPPGAYVRHNDWRRGRRMARNDWQRGQRLDYQRYHLRRPPRGYEWREVDGNYVMAAVATGLIASVIAASASR